jgi:hypothetical protein
MKCNAIEMTDENVKVMLTSLTDFVDRDLTSRVITFW